MRPTFTLLALAALAAAALPGAASPALAQGYYGPRPGPAYGAVAPRARVWLENQRDYYRHGERLRILFSSSADVYVAVLHIDPDGNLDFLFPDSPFDRDFVRGGQTYALPRGGFSGGPLVRGSGGIGYLYIIASPVPLDFGYFRGRVGYGWDWSYAGRVVRGDPFWALEQITRTLLPDYGYVPYSVDFASYYVEGLARYPVYACGGAYGAYGAGAVGFRGAWGYNPYYDSCDRLDLFLRDNPYYFDLHRYRGDRRVVFRKYGPWDPEHRYKAAPDDHGRAAPRSQAEPQGYRGPERDAPARPAQRRPTLERRPAEPEERRAEPARGATPRSAPAPESAPAAGRSGGGGSSPAPATPSRRRPGGEG